MAKRNSKKAARAAEKVAKKHPKLFTFLLVILVIALIAAACYYFFVYRKQHQGGSGGSPEVVGGNVTEIASADLSIHFIAPAVKASGDSALIKVGNTEVLIDAGPNKTNTTEIADYLGAYCTDGVLEYVIATHSDSDHIAGFVGSSSGGKRNGILYTYNVGTIIQFDQVTEETSLYREYCDAVEYAKEQGTAVYTGLQCWNGEDGAQRTYYLDEAQTISMNILYN